MGRLLDDFGRPGWMLNETGAPEGEWEIESLREEYDFDPDFPPYDCNTETMHKKSLYRKYPGSDLGEKMSAFYDSISDSPIAGTT